MHPIEVKQVKEIILVTDDVGVSRRLYRETLGLAMPAAPDILRGAQPADLPVEQSTKF